MQNKEVDLRIKKFLDNYHMKPKGTFLNKKAWISICSAHQTYNKECKTCNIGSWQNQFKLKFISLLFKYFKINIVNKPIILNMNIDENENRPWKRNKKINK